MSIINELTSTNAVAMAVATALESAIGNDVILGVGRPKLVAPTLDVLPPGTLRVAVAEVIDGYSGGVYVVIAEALANQLERIAPDEAMLTALAPVMDAATHSVRTIAPTISFDGTEEVELDELMSGSADIEFVIYSFIDGSERVASLVIALGELMVDAGGPVGAQTGGLTAVRTPSVETQTNQGQRRPPASATASGAQPPQNVSLHEFPTLNDGTISLVEPRALSLLHDVEMGVTAELGRKRMSVRDLLALTPGAVIELDRAAGSPVDVLVNGTLIARGEVVVIDEEFGIRISEIVVGNEVTV